MVNLTEINRLLEHALNHDEILALKEQVPTGDDYEILYNLVVQIRDLVPLRTMRYYSEEEEAIIRRMFAKLEEAGWKVSSVDDGDFGHVPADTIDEALKIIDAVGEAWVYFVHPDHRNSEGVFLIAGNGCDVISDHTCSNPVFDAIMNGLIEEEA